MNDAVRSALKTDRTIDITTTGRRSGAARRVEIWFHNLDGHIYITGMPGTRDWYANLLSDPSFTFHLKDSVTADLSARARPITDREERLKILREITGRVGQSNRLDAWVSESPLVEVDFAD